MSLTAFIFQLDLFWIGVAIAVLTFLNFLAGFAHKLKPPTDRVGRGFDWMGSLLVLFALALMTAQLVKEKATSDAAATQQSDGKRRDEEFQQRDAASRTRDDEWRDRFTRAERNSVELNKLVAELGIQLKLIREGGPLTPQQVEKTDKLLVDAKATSGPEPAPSQLPRQSDVPIPRAIPVGFSRAAAERNVISEIAYRWCPPGSFEMGSNNRPRRLDGSPALQVTLTHGFWIAETELTVFQWNALAKEGSLELKTQSPGNLPVTKISWLQARQWCEAATKHLPSEWSGWKCDLPTEAQWEYACRAGTKTDYYFGDNAGELNTYAWFGRESDGLRRVGLSKANPWGLFDVYGNVWEWCGDVYEPNYTRPRKVESYDPPAKEDRVMRGGGWADPAAYCRSASRFKDAESYGASDSLGFRPVIVMAPAARR